MSCSLFALRLTAFVALLVALPGFSLRNASADEPLQWRQVTPADVEGRGWSDVERPFDRLPARAESQVRKAVWELGRHASGISVQFTTDAAAVWVRWSLSSERLSMTHMPATGVSGVDLYVKRDGAWQFAAAARPKAAAGNEAMLLQRRAPKLERFQLNFPLYNGVTSLEIGVNEGAAFTIEPPRTTGAVVFYGTSITQGGCASRPGMSYVAILGRRLDVPVINLGFSGNGKAEPELAELIAELDPAVFVLDPLGNLFPEQVTQRLPGMISEIRKRHAQVPILLNENLYYANTTVSADRLERVDDSNRRVNSIVDSFKQSGDLRIDVIPASDLTQFGGDTTVDGAHPTDLGMMLMADAIEPSLREALALAGVQTAARSEPAYSNANGPDAP